jgi:succinoglycan biosynthesis transport protein ExoP
MFTSASIGDGKTTSAIEMSKTLAASGLRVVLLDLDLRKPDVGGQLGVSSDVLTLFGSSPRLSDALEEAPGVPDLLVFSGRPSGGATPMLEALFRQLPEMLAQAREISDVVVVDTAPLGRVSDALRVAAFADDVIFVARPGNTDRRDLRSARELLEHSGVTPTGMIIVGGTSSAYGFYGETVDIGARSYGVPPDQPRPVRAVKPVASSGRHRKKRDARS